MGTVGDQTFSRSNVYTGRMLSSEALSIIFNACWVGSEKSASGLPFHIHSIHFKRRALVFDNQTAGSAVSKLQNWRYWMLVELGDAIVGFAASPVLVVDITEGLYRRNCLLKPTLIVTSSYFSGN